MFNKTNAICLPSKPSTGDTISLPPFSTISLIFSDKLSTSKHM